jgi:hypothetical protein
MAKQLIAALMFLFYLDTTLDNNSRVLCLSLGTDMSTPLPVWAMRSIRDRQ